MDLAEALGDQISQSPEENNRLRRGSASSRLHAVSVGLQGSQALAGSPEELATLARELALSLRRS
jgi:hypothetical protein